MNKSVLTTILLITGCSPLQQAPLVYTSKQVLGIDISAPTTESMGVSMNVGFKNIDAAYVPLAVSKAAEGGQTYAIEPIYATYGEGPQAEQIGASLKRQQSVSELTKDLAEKTRQVGLLQLAKTQLLERKMLTNNVLPPNSKPLVDQFSDLVPLPSNIENKLRSNQALTNKEVQQTLMPVNDIIKTKEAAVDQKQKEIIQALSITKYDAMSVFGSFDSGVKGDSNSGVSNKLGKMFSTGVAAQNLTQGMQRHAVLEQCLDLIQNTKDETQKKNLISMCSSSMSTNSQAPAP